MGKVNWAEYFKAYRASLEEVQEEDDEPQIIMLERGKEIPVTDAPKAAQKLAGTLQALGFEVKAGTSKTFHPGSVFASGEKEGQKRPDKTVQHYWVQGRSEDGKKLWAWWEQTSFKGALHNANGSMVLIDSKQKERTGETPTGALQGVLDGWSEACIF